MPMLKTRYISSLSTPPCLLEELEERRDLPRAQIDGGVDLVVQGPIEIAGESATGDVGHPGDDLLDLVAGEELHDRLGIDPGRLEEYLDQGALLVDLRIHLSEVEPGGLDDLADEGVPVGVDAARGQTDQDVTGFDPCRIDRASSTTPTVNPAMSKSPGS